MGDNIGEYTFTATLESAPTLKPKRTKKDVSKDIEKLKQEQKLIEAHEQNLECATQIYDLYECYIEAGFDETQAWKLIIEQIKALKK